MSCSGDCGPIVVTLLTGAPGVQGEQGVQGVQGPQGPEGPQGPAGSVGTVTGDVSISTAGVATLSTVGVAALAGGAGKALTLQVDAKGRVLAVTAQDASITTSQVQNLSLATLGGVSTTDPRLTDSRTPTGAASGDLAGTYPAPTLATVGTAGVTGAVDKALVLQTDAKGRVLAVTAQAISITTAQVQNLSLATLGGVATTDPRLSDARTPSGAAGGDLAGTYPNPTLGTVTTAGSAGSATVVPVVTIDAKGRVTSLSSAQIAALTTAQVAGLSTATPAAIATTGAVGAEMFAARADHVHALATFGISGVFGSGSAVPVVTVDAFGRVASVTTAATGALTTNDIRGLSTVEGAALTTAGVVGLSLFAARGDHSHKVATVYARTKTVGVDAATIQGCIDLITDASATNQAQVVVPPGYYVENLTLKPCVSVVASGANNGQISTVRIVGNATFTGGATAADNTLQLVGLSLNTNHATLPALTVAASGGVTTLLNVQDCMVTSSNSASTAVGIQVGINCSARLVNVRTQGNTTAGQGGTHVDVDGGTFYAENWTTEFGTRALLLRGTNGALKPYGELKWSNISVSGANAIEITSATALLTMGWVSVGNLAATGNGINVAAGSVVGATQCVFAVQAGASNYVVTGAVGSYYYSLGNSYSNATGAPYETKIGASVTQFQYARSYDPASGDLTGSFPAPTLAAVTTAQSNVGSATVIPRLSIDAKGRVTALSTVAVSALTTAQLAGLSTATPAVLATTGAVGTSLFAARADHVHALTTLGVAGTFGSASAVPVVTVDAFGRVASVTTAGISGGGGASLTTADAAPLGALASAGVSALAARGDHIHPLPTAAQVGAIATTGTVKLSINTALATTAALSLAPLAVAPAAPTAGDIWVRGNILEFAGTGSTVATPGSNQNNTYTGVQTFSNRVSVTATSGSALTVTQGGGGTNSGAIVTGSSNSGVPLMRVTQTGAGDALVVEDSANPDSTPFTVNAVGRVGIGLSVATTETAALTVDAGGIKFADGTLQTTAIGALTTAGLASLSSPAFTGIPTAPTASAGTNTTQIATTAFVLTNGGDKYKTTSSTTAAIANGTQTFTVAAGLSYTPTQDVTIVANVSNHMHGTVTSYSGTTLVVDVSQHTGSGTFSSWTINVGGAVSGGAALTTMMPHPLSLEGSVGGNLDAARSDHVHPACGDLYPLPSSTNGEVQVRGLRGFVLQDCVGQANGMGVIWNGSSAWDYRYIPVLSSTMPSSCTSGDSGSAGTSYEAARSDHQHPMPNLVQLSNSFGDTPLAPGVATAGTGTVAARWDHVHPEQTLPVGSNAVPAGLSEDGKAGTSNDFSRSDHEHPLPFGQTYPSDLAAEPSFGGSAQAARADHVHRLPAADNLPSAPGTAFAGTSLLLSRSDHVHPAQETYASKINEIISFLNNQPYNAGISLIP